MDVCTDAARVALVRVCGNEGHERTLHCHEFRPTKMRRVVGKIACMHACMHTCALDARVILSVVLQRLLKSVAPAKPHAYVSEIDKYLMQKAHA